VQLVDWFSESGKIAVAITGGLNGSTSPVMVKGQTATRRSQSGLGWAGHRGGHVLPRSPVRASILSNGSQRSSSQYQPTPRPQPFSPMLLVVDVE
jgi:hypothetical protein